MLRDASEGDFRQILTLNAQFVAKLSPLSYERLVYLHDQAALHRIVDDEGVVVAFLLAFREDAIYDSPNFEWFRREFDKFLYVDRLVVQASRHGGGLGTILYRDLFAFAARTSVPTVACEFDIDPPNPASERFHAKFGFREVGRQHVAGGKKLVSLQTASVRTQV